MRRLTRFKCDWSSDVCSSDLIAIRPDVSFGSPRRKNGNGRPKRKSLLTSKHAMPCERPLQSSQSPQNLVHAPEGGALIARGFTARVGRAGGAPTTAPSPVPARTAERCYAEPAEVIRRATPGQEQAPHAR